ncbi:hypothetical protein PoB_001338600 [Plakobranchus ocellatus]|uniref:Uncharacterized protein n=1 Tax=Plakobranchus ocellatus TaxID=259542 RepID=A0AAV3YTW8_9GAST|nr:hypothetical protein PoB_001338600 [Plakobranchus ocellatus]
MFHPHTKHKHCHARKVNLVRNTRGLVVSSPSINYPIVAEMVSKPADKFFYNYRNFFEMETGAKYFYYPTC